MYKDCTIPFIYFYVFNFLSNITKLKCFKHYLVYFCTNVYRKMLTVQLYINLSVQHISDNNCITIFLNVNLKKSKNLCLILFETLEKRINCPPI